MASLSIVQVSELLRTSYGLKGELTVLESEWGGTYRVDVNDGSKLLLKIAPSTVAHGRTEMELEAIRHLGTQLFNVKVPQLYPALNGKDHILIGNKIARIYHWIEGRLLAEVNPRSNKLLHSLGSSLAHLKNGLDGYDHAAGHGQFDWSPHGALWIEPHINDLKEGAAVSRVLRALQAHRALVEELPHGINFNDANDHNIIVSGDVYDPEVIGFIDFGDLHHGPLINDLAISLAYALMGLNDPIEAACSVIRGYVSVRQLSEQELRVLLILIKSRLAISIVVGQKRAKNDPANEYWQVSMQPAQELLERLDTLSDHFVLCMFRHAAGYEPDPNGMQVRNWLNTNFHSIYPIVGRDLTNESVCVFDWSVESLEMGSFDDIADVPSSSEECFNRMRAVGVEVGIGRYDEPRAVYTSAAFQVEGDNGIKMRTLHIGLDIFMQAGSPLYAPLDGNVVCVCDNEQVKGYGPLVILKHEIAEELTFYTLYGHCSPETIAHLTIGQKVSKGQLIAWIGDYPENGDWVPHVHFQIMTNLMGYENDFPGVALYDQRDVWLSICPDPNLMVGVQHPDLSYHHQSLEELLSLRQELLPGNLSVSHRTPLNIVRGWRTRLYSADGISYLDTRNNIAHVGHEKPWVSKAILRQSAVLNTNTRYLHSERIRLASRILATLPGKVNKIIFVNSGSEANDLALRIARTFTETKATLVMDQAYHGHTVGTIEVSPYKFLGSGGFEVPAYVTILPELRTVREDQSAFALHSVPADKMTFIHEALPSCAGQIVPPQNYFKEIYTRVRENGGICIADEVQTGLGRVGDAFWAFELFDVEPDIVTIGKPLGNGHPVAAVALTTELAESFDNGMEYFNSFGGNPVSCAAAHAVLDVIEADNLQTYAAHLGSVWMDHLRALMAKGELITDVRGFGLFFGIEIGSWEDESATKKARYIQHRMMDHRILTSLDGPGENVIKIKPPLTISEREVDYFMTVFEKILGEDVIKS